MIVRGGPASPVGPAMTNGAGGEWARRYQNRDDRPLPQRHPPDGELLWGSDQPIGRPQNQPQPTSISGKKLVRIQIAEIRPCERLSHAFQDRILVAVCDGDGKLPDDMEDLVVDHQWVTRLPGSFQSLL